MARAARLLDQHEREEAHRLRLGEELDQQPPDADRLLRKLRARHRAARGGGIALVEDEVDDAQHRVEPLRELLRAGHLVGDARVADLRLRAHDALREGGRGRQEGVRDLLGLQPAHLAQRERHLRVGRERRVAAGEDEPQAVVLDVLFLGIGLRRQVLNLLFVQGINS